MSLVAITAEEAAERIVAFRSALPLVLAGRCAGLLGCYFAGALGACAGLLGGEWAGTIAASRGTDKRVSAAAARVTRLAMAANPVRCAAWARKGPATAPSRPTAASPVRKTALIRPRTAFGPRGYAHRWRVARLAAHDASLRR